MHSCIRLSKGPNGRHAGSLLLILVCSWALAAWPHPANAAARPAAGTSPSGTCVVSSWGPFTPCSRTGLDHWAHSHSRAVQQPAADCPALTETLTCEPTRGPRPSDAATAAQQAVSGLLVSLPLAVAVALKSPAAANSSNTPVVVTPELAAALAAGRALWQQQASRTDKLQCTPFNGPAQLLTDAGAATGTGFTPALPDVAQLAAARAAFAAAAKAVAVQAAHAETGTSSPQQISSRLDPFRRAIVMPGDRGDGSPGKGVVLPDPAADATADVVWDGSNSMTAAIAPGPGMGAAAAATAKLALHDGLGSVVPWLAVQATAAAPALQQPAAWIHLNMTYDSSMPGAIFNTVPPTSPPAAAAAAAAAQSSQGALLLSIQQHLTGIYGLDLASTAAREALMALPVSEAVLRTHAGGGVDQLGASLAGAWTQANLTAALGLHPSSQQGSSSSGNSKASFTFTDPVLLFSAAPAALYVSVQADVSALGVTRAPATLNLRPGGAAALELFEPCEPVQGLQLSNVQLQLEPEGGLTGVASGRLANTAVSSIASVSATAPAPAASASAGAEQPEQDLSLVMTAETVGAGNLSDVITIITRKDPPVRLLQVLEQARSQQQQQRMQFSSVTLTYQSPKIRRRQGGGGGDTTDGGFNMVAVPDVAAAPPLKQMLDAIGLNQESLTLRTSSISSVGSAFASSTPFVMQLPAPFSASGPTVLTLQYGQNKPSSAGSGGNVMPADTLITASLAGTSTTAVRLPGVATPVSLDLSSVTVSTPTAIVGAAGLGGTGGAPGSTAAPVTAELGGISVGPLAFQGLPFLQFDTLNVSARAGFQPLTFQDLSLSGPLTAFGLAGTATFGTNIGPALHPQQQQQHQQQQEEEGSSRAAAAVELSTYLPAMDVPLLARSLGANVSLGLLSANLVSLRARTTSSSSSSSSSAAGSVGKAPSNAEKLKQAGEGAVSLAATAQLQMLGMSSYVSFDLSAQQGASISAMFVAGQINKVMMPNLLSAVTASLQSVSSMVTSAAAAAGSGSGSGREAALRNLQTEAQEAVAKARQQLDAATATHTTAKQQAVGQLQAAAVSAEAASAAYQSARLQSGAALVEARNELNTADTAFNQAKTLAYKELNVAQQTYKEALAGHEGAVQRAQDRVDSILAQLLQLRADYNSANTLCSPTPEGLQHCQAAATAWARYRAASVALDSAQTALQEAAVSGPAAQRLQAAKADFAARQAAANEVVNGKEWAAHAAAAAKLSSATTALQEAQQGQVAAAMHVANSGFARAQEACREVLTAAADEYVAVREAKHAMKAARSGLRAATAVARLSPEELEAATADLTALLTQIQRQQAALASAAAAAAAAAGGPEGCDVASHAAAAAAAGPSGSGYVAAASDAAAAVLPAESGSLLVRFDHINVGFNLAPSDTPVLLAVSYSGAVGSGEQQQPLTGLFQVDASDGSSEELGLMLADVLRNDVLSAFKVRHRSLSALM